MCLCEKAEQRLPGDGPIMWYICRIKTLTQPMMNVINTYVYLNRIHKLNNKILNPQGRGPLTLRQNLKHLMRSVSELFLSVNLLKPQMEDRFPWTGLIMVTVRITRMPAPDPLSYCCPASPEPARSRISFI